MNNLYIEWKTGHMEIYMDAFFPCTIEKFKKVLKVIELDQQHCDELIETLKVYFQNRQTTLAQEAVEVRNKAVKYRMQATEYKATINMEKAKAKKEGILPNLQELYGKYDESRELAKIYEAKAKQIPSYKAKFKKYLELL